MKQHILRDSTYDVMLGNGQERNEGGIVAGQLLLMLFENPTPPDNG